MTTPNETTAVAIRDSLIGRELAINVRAGAARLPRRRNRTASQRRTHRRSPERATGRILPIPARHPRGGLVHRYE